MVYLISMFEYVVFKSCESKGTEKETCTTRLFTFNWSLIYNEPHHYHFMSYMHTTRT